MAAVGYFLWGLGAEIVRLMLVLATAGLASSFFGGRMGPASPGAMAAMLVVFGLYSLLVLVPARDIVQGWLGMVAGRRPPSYGERGENLGRFLGDLLLVGGFLWVMVVTFGVISEREDASSNAFGFAYMMFALLVFGLGSAVPRLWFATRQQELDRSDPTPELLAQAGKRASIFCYAAFMSAGLALTAARVTALARGMAPAARHRGMAVAPPPAPPVHREYSGTLCITPAKDCPGQHYLEVFAPRTGPLEVRYGGLAGLPTCPVAPTLPKGTDPVVRDRFAAQLSQAKSSEVTAVIDVKKRDLVMLSLFLTEDLQRCGYRVVVDQPPRGGAR